MTISPSYPFTLTNGTTADATQVMADFLQIQNDVNANAAHNGANSDITSITGLLTALGITQGGTGANTASGARTALGLGAAAVENLGGEIIDDGAGNLTIAANAALAGSPTTTTQAGSDNSTKIATTAQVKLSIIDTGPLLKANNLSDLASLATALTNLGFATAASANGSVTLPGGIIIKWGNDSQQLNPSTVTFGAAFPSNCWAVVTTISNAIDGKRSSTVASISKTAFTYYTGEGSAGNEGFNITWIAIGN